MAAKHVRVTGRVQGVAFRAWTQDRARSLGLSGWVRNRSDGSVEAVVAGPDEAVAALIVALHDGPPQAQVDEVSVTAAEAPADAGFLVLG